MSKNIWIINEYAGTPYHGMEFRHYYLGKEFVKLGYKVTVVSSSYSHLFKKLPEKNKENIDGVDYIWLKMFNYGNSHSKKRVLKWFLFMIKCFFLPLIIKNKPDTIIVSPMAPFPILPAWLISKYFRSKLIYEVKDIWPLSLIELGGFNPKHPFIKLMSWFENFALRKSDNIVSNLGNYGEHTKNLGINRDFEWISNGISLEELEELEFLDENIKKQIPNNKFIVGYTGTIGVANAIDSFLDATKQINNDSILFVIVGDGQEKHRLKSIYKNNKNILFLESIPKKQIQSMLTNFDICFLGWKKERLYSFGTSANKIFDYMYSGKVILNSINSGNNVVELAKCGLVVESENSKAIADGIIKLYNMTEIERKQLGENGKKYVLENFTYDKLAKKYTKILKD